MRRYEGLDGTMKEQGITCTASKFFTDRVRRNLHILSAFSESGASLQRLTMDYPALLRKMYVDACLATPLLKLLVACEHI